jgi:hypothetical protein
MRYLGASLNLIVAVVLIQDYVLIIVVSTLSGVDQLLSITNAYGIHWFWHLQWRTASINHLVPDDPGRAVGPNRIHTAGLVRAAQ